MSDGRPFELDRFQVEAMASVDAGRSVLVAAPTSSGKTVVAEHAVDRALAEGRRTFYTAPIKALSNQKFRDLGRRLGTDRVGLMTGDQVVAPEAPVVVMTTEVLRNMLYSRSDATRGLGWVVLDEVHFLEDPYRGAVWEEVVLNLAPDVGVVALSATVSNAGELGDWLTAVRGPTDVVVETRRPVLLRTHYLVAERGRGRRLHRLATHRGGSPNPDGRHFDADGNFIGATLEKSAGNKMLDREAVRAVKAVKYPALPARMAGKPVTVPMEVLFSNTLRKQDRIKLRATSYEIAQKYNSDTMVASAATK